MGSAQWKGHTPKKKDDTVRWQRVPTRHNEREVYRRRATEGEGVPTKRDGKGTDASVPTQYAQ